MGKNHFDRSQSLARVSSASTETDYIPATVPFDWETAPGRSAAAERKIIEAPSLPLPPGRRPKDGFFLPISRSVQRPNLLNEEGGIDSSPRERRSFNLKFPGSSKKTLFRSREQRKIRKDADCVEDTGSFFNPLSAHRLGSRITRRVLVESQKSPSCFGQCLPVGRKASSSQIDHHGGRGLDDAEDSDGEEHYATPRSSASSGFPLSSPRHGHGKMRDSSITGAGKQLQVPSSRFNMASMLIALFPSESDDSDEYNEAETVGGHEFTEDDDGEVRISEYLSTPRTPVSNSRRSGKLQQIRPVSDNFTNKSDERNTFRDCEGKVADAHSVSESPDRDLGLRPTRKSRQSSFSWKSSDQIREKLDPLSAFLMVNEQESEEFANKRSEKIDGEEDIIHRERCSSLVWSLCSCHSNCSSSSNHTRRSSGQNVVLLDSAASKMVLPTPRSSCGSSDLPVTNSCSLDNPKAEVERGKSSSACATPTAEPSFRRDSFEERLERNHSPPRPPTSSLSQSPLQNQSKMQIAIPKAFRTENIKVPSNSPLWLQELKSSSLWPNRAQEITQGDAGNRDRGDESGEDIEHSSTDSFEYRTPRADSSTPSISSPVLRSLSASPKPATWVLSEEVLKSSSMFQRKIQRQQSYESPRRSFMLDEVTTTVPSPSRAFEQISIETTRLPTDAPDECHVNSPDYGSKGEDLATSSVMALSETSGSKETSKEVQEESKAGVGSSGKSFPIYLRRRGSATITGKAISR